MYSMLWNMSCALLVLGALCAAAALFLRIYAQKDEVYRGHAEARVVDIVAERRTGDASLSEFRNRQAAVFEFYANGQLYKVRDPADTYPCPYYLNQRVRINYDEGHPERFEIARPGIWERLASVSNILGVCFILAGCVLYLVYAARAGQ